jgi:hypothetical protein
LVRVVQTPRFQLTLYAVMSLGRGAGKEAAVLYRTHIRPLKPASIAVKDEGRRRLGRWLRVEEGLGAGLMEWSRTEERLLEAEQVSGDGCRLLRGSADH